MNQVAKELNSMKLEEINFSSFVDSQKLIFDRIVWAIDVWNATLKNLMASTETDTKTRLLQQIDPNFTYLRVKYDPLRGYMFDYMQFHDNSAGGFHYDDLFGSKARENIVDRATNLFKSNWEWVTAQDEALKQKEIAQYESLKAKYGN